MKISLIAVIGKNRELGKDNKLLWNIPEDMAHFRQLTSNHTIIMGRKTYESIGHPLPNRTNIVITHDSSFARGPLANLIVCNSFEEALDRAKEFEENESPPAGGEVFVIGGGQIYEQAMPFADKLYLTLVDETADADTFFPDYSMFKKIIAKKEGESGGHKYTFLDLEK